MTICRRPSLRRRPLQRRLVPRRVSVDRPRTRLRPRCTVLEGRTSNLSRKDDEWPKDIPGLWARCLQWAQETGREPSIFIVWVWQMRGLPGAVQGPAIRCTPAIRGDEVVGGEGLSAGEAIVTHITDVYHFTASPNDPAQYKIEVQLTSGPKVRSSEFWPMDRPEKIIAARRAIASKFQREDPVGYTPQPQPSVSGWRPTQPTPTPQQAPAPPPTGNPHLDEYLAFLRQQIVDKDSELRNLRDVASLPPIAGAQVGPSAATLDEDAKQAKLLAGVAQTVLQTLIAAGVVKPQGHVAQPAPTTVDTAQAAVRTSEGAADILDSMVSDIERNQKREDRFRSVMGLPSLAQQRKKEIDDAVAAALEENGDPDDPIDPPHIHVEPAQTQMRSWKLPGIWGGKDIIIPRYSKEDDDSSFGQKVANFFGANPDVGKDIIGQVVSVALTKMDAAGLSGLLGQLAMQGGAGAVAASAMRGAVNGAGGNGSSGAGSA